MCENGVFEAKEGDGECFTQGTPRQTGSEAQDFLIWALQKAIPYKRGAQGP